jgi:hypothetical protein
MKEPASASASRVGAARNLTVSASAAALTPAFSQAPRSRLRFLMSRSAPLHRGRSLRQVWAHL